jgi:hypothetical protein
MQGFRSHENASRLRASCVVLSLFLWLLASSSHAKDQALTEREQTTPIHRLFELIAQKQARPELIAEIGEQLHSWMVAGKFRNARNLNDLVGAPNSGLADSSNSKSKPGLRNAQDSGRVVPPL